MESQDLIGRYLAKDVVDPETGEVIAECNDEITEKLLDEMKDRKVEAFEILFIDNINVSSSLRDTLVVDKIGLTQEERGKLSDLENGKSLREKESERALIDIYKRLRPGDPPTIETAIGLFYNPFFNPERYDLSKVGRMKLNHKIGLKANPPRVLVFTEKLKKEALAAGAAALRLFRKSNPPLVEWLGSPIIYIERFSLAATLRRMAENYYSPQACIYHYLHMASGNYRQYLKGEQVW